VGPARACEAGQVWFQWVSTGFILLLHFAKRTNLPQRGRVLVSKSVILEQEVNDIEHVLTVGDGNAHQSTGKWASVNK
jgi:hypothetical protein